jgi:hypothetical protein
MILNALGYYSFYRFILETERTNLNGVLKEELNTD